MLAVTLSKNARARRAVPAWNEALGLPRPWDQQWSLRMQQILAYETDLLEYGDIFDGSPAIAAKVENLKREAKEELAHIGALGGAVAAVEQGYMKQRLVESNTRRVEAIERGEQTVVGVNRFVESEPSPLAGAADAIVTVSPRAKLTRSSASRAGALAAIRRRSPPRSRSCAPRRKKTATSCRPRLPAPRPASPPANGPLRCARLRRVPRADQRRARACATRLPASTTSAPTSTGSRASSAGGSNSWSASPAWTATPTSRSRCARGAGMDVVYEGIRLTPAEIVEAAREQHAHVVGLSILSGSHVPLVDVVTP